MNLLIQKPAKPEQATILSMTYFKRHFDELLDRVEQGGKTCIVTHRGRQKAAIIPVQQYRELQLLRE